MKKSTKVQITRNSGVTHTICRSEKGFCREGLLAVRLAEEQNVASAESHRRLSALAKEAIEQVQHSADQLLTVFPEMAEPLQQLNQISVARMGSAVPNINLCRAVCDGRRLLGCGVKTESGA